MDNHREKVNLIASRVRNFYDRKQPYRIYHGSTNCTRASTKSTTNTVNISSLRRVLEVDPIHRVVKVEPNVAMDDLVNATLPFGLIPPVVMEFPGITAGGGFAGTSGESSSFRHGFFDRTVNLVEMVLANGEIVEASADYKPDLFYGAAASFGCLGITTLLEIRLVPAKPYVQMTYFPIANGVSEAVQKLDELTADPTWDYLDGIMYSREQVVLCGGKLVDFPRPGIAVQTFMRPTDPWFYMHVERRALTGQYIEYIPLKDYLFRYDRGGFWVGKYAFEYFGIPQSRFTRWLLDGISHTRVMYHAVHKSGLFGEYTIQDIAVPYAAASNLIDYLDQSFQRYPIWLCPLRQTTRSQDSSIIHGLLAHHNAPSQVVNEPEMMLSLGIWGPGPGSGQGFVQFNRNLERKVQELGGQKWLYGRTYYSEDEFSSIYPPGPFEVLRKRYHASHLPTLYDKVKAHSIPQKKGGWFAFVTDRWPFCGLYGLLHTFLAREYLLDHPKRGIPGFPIVILFCCLLCCKVLGIENLS